MMKRLFIQTIGCQMNVYDSDRMAMRLAPLGYVRVSSLDAADLILVNTCAIRAKAEQKLFSYLGRLAEEKIRRPHLIIGVGGCVAQQEGPRVIQRAPHVDLVFGTDAVHRLPELVTRVAEKRQRLVDVRMENAPFSSHGLPGVSPTDKTPTEETNGSVCRFVTIMQGCDNYCTYCVVPYVRGRERSREPESIVAEIGEQVSTGAREVTLLGQNVNSYGKKENGLSFPELLGRVNTVPGLLRIRFTTSHPKDLSRELIACFGNVGKLCRHVHLPVQSGSDRILEKMNRKYSIRQYLEQVDLLRRQRPDIAVTSDIIVGFPGETDEQFGHTLDLIRTVRFDGLFAFMYSDRPNAAASRFPDKVPERQKAARLKAVLDLQKEITWSKNKALEGTVQTVLVEGESKPAPETSPIHRWTGRTECNRIVHFTAPAPCPVGSLVSVHIEQGHAHSLLGRWMAPPQGDGCFKGD